MQQHEEVSVRFAIEVLAAILAGRWSLPIGAHVQWFKGRQAYLIHPAALPGLAALLGPAWATDHGQLGPISPEIRTWARTLENKLKMGCCASADGWKPEAVEYDIAADHYRVRIEGEWHDVPADALLDGPNKFGFPMVWYYRTYLNGEKSALYIRCFLPGAGG